MPGLRLWVELIRVPSAIVSLHLTLLILSQWLKSRRAGIGVIPALTVLTVATMAVVGDVLVARLRAKKGVLGLLKRR